MPKSAKQKKSKVADFTKTKLKLGKGKQVANNAVDTSFKARSIALPTQSIAAEKSNAPTTRRNLSFDDLVLQTRHFNAGTRRDAILGFRELFEAHPSLLSTSLTVLFNTTARLIPDEDGPVRKTLLSFFLWAFPRIPTADLSPHAPLLLLYTTSAQTHIFPEIRVDAIRYLDIFLEFIPRQIVEGWNDEGHGNRILKGYLGLLNAGTQFDNGAATSTASTVLSAASKLVVLESIANFLGQVLVLDVDTIPSWCLAASFKTRDAYNRFDELLRPDEKPLPRQWKHIVEDQDEDFIISVPIFTSPPSLIELHKIELDIDTTSSTSTLRHLSRALHSTLISTFLDCAPTAFSPSSTPSEQEVNLVIAVARIARCLYGGLLRGSQASSSSSYSPEDDLKVLLNYMTPYFPFRLDAGGRKDMKTVQAFQDLNLIYCELSSLISSKKVAANTQTHIDRVKEYVLDLLDGMSSGLSRPLSTAEYTSLIPTLWSLLEQRATSQQVLHAITDHSVGLSSKSGLKRTTIEFVGSIILITTEPQYIGPFRIEQKDDKIQQWILHLPKVLWEVGGTTPNGLAVSEVISRFLLRLLQRKPQRIVLPATVDALESRLIPYFTITHPERGRLSGPFAKIGSAGLKSLVLDTIATLVAFSENGTSQLAEVVSSVVEAH
ncbi:hypothetical protein C8J56DRAFT_851089 [Mycena floridula]|nr:hypothetical protein C8J56DRAFT_851089 [Mycena floridula]